MPNAPLRRRVSRQFQYTQKDLEEGAVTKEEGRRGTPQSLPECKNILCLLSKQVVMANPGFCTF